MNYTDKPRSENTLIVMLDPTGTAECFDVVHLPADDPTERDQVLTRCINRYCMIQYEGTFVPDNRIQVYEYGMDAHLENRFWQFTTDRSSISNYIGVKEISPSYDFSLRTAFYLFEQNGKISSYKDLDVSGPKKDIHFRRIKEYLDGMRKLDRKGPAIRFVESIRTGRGTLYFGEDGVAQHCMKNYLQQLADHYFDPENRNLSTLCHKQTMSSRALDHFVTQAKNMFCLHNQVLIERKVIYQDPRAQQGLQGAEETIAMGPNIYDFQNFIKRFKLGVSEKNQTICALIQIAETGINDQVRPPIRYRRAFEDKQSRVAEIAGRLLKLNYGVNVVPDHPELNQSIQSESHDASTLKQTQYHY